MVPASSLTIQQLFRVLNAAVLFAKTIRSAADNERCGCIFRIYCGCQAADVRYHQIEHFLQSCQPQKDAPTVGKPHTDGVENVNVVSAIGVSKSLTVLEFDKFISGH